MKLEDLSSPSTRSIPSAKEPRAVRVGADPEQVSDGTNQPTRTMTVTVVDAVTGKPLPNAEVFAPVGGWRKALPRRLTDERGQYRLCIPLPPAEYRQRMGNINFTLTHPNFAPRGVAWTYFTITQSNFAPRGVFRTSSPGDVFSILPSDVTVKLELGIAIGGTVRDEGGAPLACVRVLLSGSNYRGFTMGTGEQKAHEYAKVSLMDTAEPAAVTGADGRWTYAHFPSELAEIEVTLVRPDDSRQAFATSASQHLNSRPLVSLRALKEQTAVLTLRDGVTVRGIVTDEEGKPLADVLVKEGYGHANIQRVSEFLTGADGRFERRNRAPRQWIYTASADGRATVSVVAQVEPTMAEIRIVLPAAKPLRLRVVDDQGQPLPNADVRLEDFRNEGQILDWSGRTDAAGQAEWPTAPTAPVTFYVICEKLGAHRMFKTLASEEAKVCVLSQKTELRAVVQIKAFDVKTRAPVKMHSVAAFCNGEHTIKTLAEPAASEAKVEICASDFVVGMGTRYKLKVEAEGYEPFITELVDIEEGDLILEAALVPGTALEGVVLQSSGEPAAGARVWVQPQEDAGSVFAKAPGRYYDHGDRWLKVQTGADGRFQLPVLGGNPSVVITHRNGFLETTFAGLRGRSQVRLLSWGRIEGHLLVAGQPRGGIRVYLTSPNHFAPFNLTFITISDPDGAFLFTEVPPGDYLLFRSHTVRMGAIIVSSHQMPITVKPGETLRVDYGIQGRAVVGQVVSDPVDLAVDWQNDSHTLAMKLPAAPAPTINREDYATFKAFQEVHTTSLQSPERLRLLREARNYELVFESDGGIRIDDVPPGSYELRIKVTKPLGRGHMRHFEDPADELGSLIKEVVVPPGGGAFDLGTISVPMKSAGVSPKA